MSNERDTQFLGFARLLWKDLLEANGLGYIDVNTDDDPTDPTNYLAIISKRAWWLAAVVAHHILTERPGEIPDIAEWPPE